MAPIMPAQAKTVAGSGRGLPGSYRPRPNRRRDTDLRISVLKADRNGRVRLVGQYDNGAHCWHRLAAGRYFGRVEILECQGTSLGAGHPGHRRWCLNHAAGCCLWEVKAANLAVGNDVNGRRGFHRC